MLVHIQDLKFQCILGILDFERTTLQDIIIDIEISYIYTTEFINYAEVTDLSKSIMINEKFFLIEDAISYLSKKLQEKFPLIKTLQLKISKPSILPDCKVSVSDYFSFDS